MKKKFLAKITVNSDVVSQYIIDNIMLIIIINLTVRKFLTAKIILFSSILLYKQNYLCYKH